MMNNNNISISDYSGSTWGNTSTGISPIVTTIGTTWQPIRTGTTFTTTTYNTISTETVKLWGDDVEIVSFNTDYLMIAQLNLSGYKLWDELKKVNVKSRISDTLYNSIEKIYVKEKRRSKISSVLNKTTTSEK